MPSDIWLFRDPVVHQATGMVAAQLDVTMAAAREVLSRYSAEHRQPLVDVAREVVARQLRPRP
jgi:hypothetical protein